MTRPKKSDGRVVAEEVLGLADEALEKLDACLARANDIPRPEDRRDVSMALQGVRQRMRDVLPGLRSRLNGADVVDAPRIRGSGG